MDGNYELRKLGNEELRKLGNEELRKLGTKKFRKFGGETQTVWNRWLGEAEEYEGCNNKRN